MGPRRLPPASMTHHRFHMTAGTTGATSSLDDSSAVGGRRMLGLLDGFDSLQDAPGQSNLANVTARHLQREVHICVYDTLQAPCQLSDRLGLH